MKKNILIFGLVVLSIIPLAAQHLGKEIPYNDVFTIALYHEPPYSESPVAMDEDRLRANASIILRISDRRARLLMTKINIAEALESPVASSSGGVVLFIPQTLFDFIDSDGNVIYSFSVNRLGEVKVNGGIRKAASHICDSINKIFSPYYTNNLSRGLPMDNRSKGVAH